MSGVSLSYNRWLYSKKTLVLFVVFILGLMFLRIKEGNIIALPILNFLLIPVAVAAFEYGYAFSYFISLSASAVIFILMIYSLGLELPYMVSIIFLNLVPLAPGYFNRIYNRYRISKNSALKDTEASFNRFSAELRSLKDINVTLEAQASEILDLYEVTRKMSAYLDMTGALKAFRDTVGNILKFDKLKLILINDERESPIATVKYEILTDISKERPSQFDQLLAETASSRKEVIYLKSPVDDAHPFKRYLDDPSESFAVLPLLSEDIPIGILTVSGADEEDIEKFSIMAEQLALEVKKINLYEKVQALAITDGLTNIYVRRHFLERLNEEIVRSKRHNLNLSILMMDIDHFKQCNDTYGHLVGDIVLKEMAKIMKEHVRQVDLVGRYGGEEFIIALPDTNKPSAANVAERIRQSIEAYRFKAYDEIITTTISIGLATFPDDGKDVPTLIDRADQALYKAKEEGRNRIILWP